MDKTRYATDHDVSQNKAVIYLILNSYLAPNMIDPTAKKVDGMFNDLVTCHMKFFIFAGHDTVASTLCYIYHLLSQNASSLRRVRDEHDNILGRDLTLTASLIIAKPHLLNLLPYTLAVIKETLRLFPAAGTARAGNSDFFITDDQGHRYPTKDCSYGAITRPSTATRSTGQGLTTSFPSVGWFVRTIPFTPSKMPGDLLSLG